MIEEAVALFALPPAEFIAERNRLAKLLRTAGRPDDAQFVAGLKRPKLAEYALNRLANDHPTLIDRLITAIGSATDAQSAAIGGKADGLREASIELRAATKAVVDGAVQGLSDGGSSGEGQRDEIVDLIREVAASGDVRALEDGVVGAAAGDAGSDQELFRGAPDPPDRSDRLTRPAKAVARPVRKAAPPPPVGPGPADRARKIQLERQARDAVAQVERAERAVAEATDQLRQAQDKLNDRTAVLEARRAVAASAEADLAAFRKEWPQK